MPEASEVINLLSQATLSDMGLFTTGSASDLSKAGHSGLFEDFSHLDAATPAVFNPAKIVVLRTPGMYDERPEFARILKSLIESHATAASGFDIEYTLETDQTPIGHNGQQMEVPMATKLAQPSPSFTFPEVWGGIVWKCFMRWIKDIKDDVTGTGLINMEANAEFISTMYSMTVLFIQFGATHRPEDIMNASIVTNMFPKGTGPFGMEFNQGAPSKKERSIPFTGLLQHNDNVQRIAFDVAESLSIAKFQGEKMNAAVESVNSMLADAGIHAQAATELTTVSGS